jgi:hypothetical protein
MERLILTGLLTLALASAVPTTQAEITGDDRFISAVADQLANLNNP